jgi:hypothetical protein
MKATHGPDMVLFGSGSIVAQLAALYVIDAYQFVVFPVVLGTGRTMFEGVDRRLGMKLTATRRFNNGIVVLNYDAPDGRWPAPLMGAFERYMREGGGLVVLHAADNAFPAWPAFNEMIGIGGWRNRGSTAGPYWYLREGQLVSDPAPGPTGSHGRRLPFRITVRADHPVTAGLPPVWMHAGDELYAHLRGPGRGLAFKKACLEFRQTGDEALLILRGVDRTQHLIDEPGYPRIARAAGRGARNHDLGDLGHDVELRRGEHLERGRGGVRRFLRRTTLQNGKRRRCGHRAAQQPGRASQQFAPL